MARNLSLAEVGFLSGRRYLLRYWDAKSCAAFDGILKTVGLPAVKLPPPSPNLNAHLERWHRSVQEECLSQLVFFPKDHCGTRSANTFLIFTPSGTIKPRET